MEVNTQWGSFLTTLFIGLILGFIFDFYRVMRGVFNLKSLMTFIFDGIYWLVAFIITFACLLFSNWAELRFYIFMGIISGWALYYKLISKYSIFMMIRVIRIIIATCQWIKKAFIVCLIHPVGYILGIFLFPFRYTMRRFSQLERKLRKWRMSKKKMTKEDNISPKN